MVKLFDPVKGFLGVTIGAALGGAAIQTVGNIAALPAGIKSATQSLIGVGVLGQAAKFLKLK